MAVDYTAALTGAASSLYSLVIWGGFTLLVGGLVSFIVYYFTFNWVSTLRYKTDTYDVIIFTRGKLKRGKNKITKFVSLQGGILSMLKHKVVAPAPPAEAIGLTSRGKRCVELEVDGVGDTRYIVKQSGETVFAPVDTDDREFYVNELKEAEERKKKTLMELIPIIAPLAVILIIFIMALVYWEDVMRPAMAYADSNIKVAEMQKETTQNQREIILLQYRLLGEEVPVEAPPE